MSLLFMLMLLLLLFSFLHPLSPKGTWLSSSLDLWYWCLSHYMLLLQIKSASSAQFPPTTQNWSSWANRVGTCKKWFWLSPDLINTSLNCRCASQIVGYTGINFSSPTLSSAISNLVPAFTFLLAIIFRFLILPFLKIWVAMFRIVEVGSDYS